MAEAALFSLTGKLLGELSSTAFKKAYERVRSNRNARKELDMLEETIQTIHSVLLDAEKKQEDSPPVKNWIGRVRDVLYEADDLLDDVATEALFAEEKKGNKVGAIFSKLIHPIISNDNIAKKVKAIRKSLDRISHDMSQFNFIQSRCENQVTGLRKTAETRPFVNEKVVFGREDEKKAIIEFLLNESDAAEESMPVEVIAVVGIGGMGKTTLAQLVYNDEHVTKMFQNKWWTCISDVPGETHVLRRISDSMVITTDSSDPKELISQAVSSSGKYLLVLDDVWDNNLAIWFDIMSLLFRGTKGSKIVVTTRFLSVPMAMQKDKSQIYDLHGLSEEKSWELFKAIAYTEKQEKSPEWVSVGREIVKKCANVPLAVKSIAGLLRTKDTLEEWKSVKDDELLKMESGEDSITQTLKLSYNHLHSNLKHCFAYCSLFIKDSRLSKEKLIHLWIAQGYCTQKGKTPEAIGHGYFMELLRRCFFQEVVKGYDGEISYCKMHDLIHDLAQDVAGEECIVLIESGSRQLDEKIRHLVVDGRLCDSWDGPPLELKTERLRSLMFTLPFYRSFALDQQIAEFRSLRSLCLETLCMSDLPSSIGELRHLRYLSLSNNTTLKALPDSITRLVNLLTLDLQYCLSLVALPNDFRKLISLRHLDISLCRRLKHMPPRFGELSSLQQLSDFKVCKRGSGLDSLANMSLQGKLMVSYDKDDELMQENIQIPHTLKGLRIYSYPNMRVPAWWEKKDLPQLVKLELIFFRRVKHLPPLRCLPLLKHLVLDGFEELEYIEEEIFSNESFFPCLRTLRLLDLPKLKGWSRQWSKDYKEHPEQSFFPHLAFLIISKCPDLEFMPRCPYLEELNLWEVREKIVHQLVSTSTASLQKIRIESCDSLKSFPGEGLTSLRRLGLYDSSNLEKVQLVSNALQKLIISGCPKVELDYLEHPEQSFFSHQMPRSPCLQELRLSGVGEKIVHQLVSTSNASLQKITIESCDSLKSFPGEGLTSLPELELAYCSNLEKVQLASNALQKLIIRECPKVKLWGHTHKEEKRGLHWASLTNLCLLTLDKIPEPEQLPDSLRHRTALGKLKIEKYQA